MNGLLLIDKPKNWTSFDVVAKVRGILRAEAKKQGIPTKIKVGHTGTLDPLATGLVVLAVGQYTKKVPELTKQNKTYEAEVTLGYTSNTDDAEGELVKSSEERPTFEAVSKVLQTFIGDIQQIPPQFSAIKVGGVRAYASARKGKEVALVPRLVHIYSISDIKYEYPKVTFICHVGSGTYIRSLARDVGQILGIGAYLSGLRRIEVGLFSVKNSLSAEAVNIDNIVKYIVK